MAFLPTPYTGPAPDSGRSLGPDQIQAESFTADLADQGGEEFEPNQPAGSGELDAAIAARLAQLDATERRLAEMEIKMELAQQAMASAAQTAPPSNAGPPPEIDPDGTPTFGQLAHILTNMFNATQVAARESAEVAALRANWPLNNDQEQQIINRFPEINNLREPKRSQAILSVYKRMTPTASAPSPASYAQPQTPSAPVAVRSVPYVETNGPSVPEPPNFDAMAAAQREYYEARKIRNTAERRAAMQSAMDKITRLQGFKGLDDMLTRTGFVSES